MKRTIAYRFIVLTVCLFVCARIHVKAQCNGITANFTFSVAPGCAVPKTVTFTNTSTGANANNNAYYIWFVNGVRFDSTFGTATPPAYSIPGGGSYVFSVQARRVGCANVINTSTKPATNVTSTAQQIYDGNGNLTYTPVWNNCIINPLAPDNFDITVGSNATLNNYTIIWGDGTPNATGASLAGGATVMHSYPNLGAYPLRIVTDNGGCIDTIRGTVLNMRPVSTSIRPLPPGQLAGCAPHTITFQDTSVYALPGTVFTWNFGDGTIITRDWTQANQPISHTYQKQASQQCIFTVSLTAINTNCNTGNPSTYSISPILIFDVDIADITPPTPLCRADRTYTFQNTSTNNCITGTRRYYWDFGDGTNTGWITTKNAQTHTFPDTGSYTLMLIDSNGCGSDTTYETIVVNRLPVAGFVANPKQGCAPLNVIFTDTSLGLGLIYAWTFQGTTPTTANTANPSRVFNTPGTYVVSLTVNNVCSPPNSVATDTIRVFARPVAAIANAVSGCVPHTIQVQNNTINNTPGATYYWTFGNGDTSTLRTPPPVTYNTPGPYTVKLVVRDSCGDDSTTVAINVSTLPTASFTAPPVCQGDSTVFTNTSVLAPGDAIVSYKWYYGDGDSSSSATPKYIYDTAGSYQAVLRIMTDKNCVDRDTQTVIVRQSPALSINRTPAHLCEGTIANFDGTVTTVPGVLVTSYQWNFANLDSATSEDTSYLFTPGTYNVQLKASNDIGCTTTKNHPVTVYPNPETKFGSTTACLGQLTQFTDSSTVGLSNTITQWAWDFNNDNITDSATQNPTFNFPSANTFKVRLTTGTNNNCFNSDSLYIVVNALPAMNISASTNSICKLDSFTLNNNTTGAVDYLWRFGDTSANLLTTSSASFKKIYTDTGAFTVVMTATTSNGCKDSSTLLINSRPLPEASYTVNDTIGCAPKNFTFSNTSQLADGYRWMINNGLTSTLTNRPDTLVIQSGQILNVELIATNIFGCRPDTAHKTLYTFSNPTPSFTMNVDSGCGPLQINFNNTTPNAVNYHWYFGNGSDTTQTNPSTIYLPSAVNDSIYTIKLIASNGPGCMDSVSRTVKVFPQPQSSFTQDLNAGCGPLPVQFTNTSDHHYNGAINDMTFDWSFGNGSTNTAKDPLQSFSASAIQDTVYQVRLIAFSKYGCSDTSTGAVRVYPNARAGFNITSPAGCGPHGTTFINTSVPNDTGSINDMTFSWDFSNGSFSTARNPASIFNASITQDSIYRVRLIAFSEHGCVDTLDKNVRVYPKPTPDFTPSVASGCAPLNVTFNNTSVPNDTGSINDMTFLWTMGNGFNSILRNPSSQYLAHLFNDTTYHIKLVAFTEHGCIDSITKNVLVHPKPIIGFTQDKTQGCGPLTVNFTNTTQIGNTYYWDFSDGDTSMQKNPQHVFHSVPMFDSIYTVSLSSLSLYGCESDTAKASIIAKYSPEADFITSQDSICGSGNIAFFNASMGGVSNTWSFGNGQISTAINPVASFAGLPTRDTTYYVRLIVTTPYQCKDTIIKPITVNPLPDASFVSVPPGCSPLNVTFNNTSLRGVKYEWDFGDATTDTARNPLKKFENNIALITRVYPVTLKTYSNVGCTDTSKQNVTVYPLPLVDFTPSKTLRCDTTEYNFLNATQGANNHLWQFGDGNTSSQASPRNYFRTAFSRDTTYLTRLISTTNFGCKDTLEKLVLAHPLVQSAFNANITSSCENLNVQFSNQSVNALSYFWLFGDGSGSAETLPQHKYSNTGSYNVKLIAYDQYGCSDTTEKVRFIEVFEVPKAAFTYNPAAPRQPDTKVSFIDQSFIGSGPLNYQWSFGDPAAPGVNATIKDPDYDYPDSGNYVVRLVVESNRGCFDTTNKEIRIFPYIPEADFEYNPDKGCMPLVVTFTNKSKHADGFLWDFGDGQRSTEVSPKHTYKRDSKYSVTLQVTGPGGRAEITKDTIIEVYPLPKANFAANPTNLILPDATTLLNNLSYDAVKAKWATYDRSGAPLWSDTSFNSSYTFLTEGAYSIELVVMSDKGCLDTMYRASIVDVIRGGEIYVPNVFTPNGDGSNEIFIPIGSGVLRHDYSLKIFDRWGKRVFETNNPDMGWDGTISGKPAITETYIWLVEGVFVGGVGFTKKGTVTLLR